MMSSKSSTLSIPTPRSSMLSIPTPRSSVSTSRSSILSRITSIDLPDDDDDDQFQPRTKTENDDVFISVPNSPDHPQQCQDNQNNGDHQGSQYTENQVRKYRRRITFIGVPEQTENDSDINSCIVITNTIQVEIVNETEPTKVNETQKDSESNESI